VIADGAQLRHEGQAAAGGNVDVWVTDEVMQFYKKNASVPSKAQIRSDNEWYRSTEVDLSPINRRSSPAPQVPPSSPIKA
jgi:hypothetical protein